MKRTRYVRVVLPGILLLLGSAAGQTRADEPITLETLRQRVARNEELIDPIKLRYTIVSSRTGELPQVRGGKTRGSGRSSSRCEVVWAQRGGRQCVRYQLFRDPNEPTRRVLSVLDGNVRTQTERPEQVTVGPVRDTDWYYILAAKLCLRPFGDRRGLSEMLVPPYATVLEKKETVDGRRAFVVDITLPERSASVTRLWIGEESGIPLRTCVYTGHPAAPQAGPGMEVNNVTPHRLPNGGWIPVTGARAVHFPTFSGYERIAVDVNSITIRPDDVPDSLFRLEPPEGGMTYNVFTGLTTTRGREPNTYEQIVAGAGKFVGGVVVDAAGAPVPGAIVAPFSIKTSQVYRLIQWFERTCAVTDARGRFALELEEEGGYELEFYSGEFVDQEVRDVPPGEHDLRVVLEKGGAVTGRVFFLSGGRKTPVAGFSVLAQAGDRLVDARLRYTRKETNTDEQGRFELKCLPTRMRDRSTASSETVRYVPLPWRIRCGSASENVLFEGEGDRREIELLLKPDVRSASPLVGKMLPGLTGLDLDVASDEIRDRRLLLCFFDMEQRPARNCVEELARRAATLKDQGIAVLAVHEKGVEAGKLAGWAKEAGVAFPVGIISGDPDDVKFAWAVRSLPWLILTDTRHVVQAEGFTIDDLDVKIRGEKP